jgi:hypothetical protein
MVVSIVPSAEICLAEEEKQYVVSIMNPPSQIILLKSATPKGKRDKMSALQHMLFSAHLHCLHCTSYKIPVAHRHITCVQMGHKPTHHVSHYNVGCINFTHNSAWNRRNGLVSDVLVSRSHKHLPSKQTSRSIPFPQLMMPRVKCWQTWEFSSLLQGKAVK